MHEHEMFFCSRCVFDVWNKFVSTRITNHSRSGLSCLLLETCGPDGTVIARRDTGQVFEVGSGACAFASKGRQASVGCLSGARMRAKSLIRVFVFGLAGLTSVSTLANADSGSGSGKVIMLANAGPHTFGSTASPQ